MRFYGNITSERASKGQGGNEKLIVAIKIKDRDKVKFVLSLRASEDGKSYRLELTDTRDSSQDKVLAAVEGKL